MQTDFLAEVPTTQAQGISSYTIQDMIANGLTTEETEDRGKEGKMGQKARSWQQRPSRVISQVICNIFD